MIKEITIEEAWEFYRKQKNKSQLYFPTHGEFFGNCKDDEIKAIICILSFKTKKRITCFLVADNIRGKGIGSELLKKMLSKFKKFTITAFTTKHSRNLFLNNGFKVISEKANDITFVEVKNEV